MTELFWFGLVGLIAVVSAIFMLLSDNAVHSALFLIVTMGCIAFLFLLLNAPFLAMIQITVYTGAIMVLFLFVIMLLGSERLRDTDPSQEKPILRRNRIFFVLGLVIVLLLIFGGVLGNVHLDLATNTSPLPQLRVLNAAPDAGTVDVYANDQLIAKGLAFNATSSYVTLQPGDYTLKVQPVQGAALTTPISVARGQQETAVDYGNNGSLNVSLIADDNSSIAQNRSGRLKIFNAYPSTNGVKLVDLGTSLNVTNAPIVIDTIKPGQSSDVIYQPEGTVNWAFVDAANPTTVLYRLDNYAIARDTSSTFVLTQEHILDGTQSGSLRPLAIPIVEDAAPSFGGPKAIGLQLFTNYMLVFQLLAVLLLASMVGAIVLTHRQTRSATRKQTGRRVVSRPLVNVIASQVGHDVTSEGEGLPELEEPAAPVGK
jgi:NADH:ubiquinone oxidoreductase subunit 6 (subunit J)